RRRDEPGGTGLLYGLYQARLRRQLQNATLPHHVAMIIDGNRRWARDRALETTASGHRAGAEKMREFLGWCDDLGIRVVTIYLLSTDNLSGRSSDELDQLFEIIADLADDLSRAADWRIQHVGTTDGLPAARVAVRPARGATRSTSCARSSPTWPPTPRARPTGASSTWAPPMDCPSRSSPCSRPPRTARQATGACTSTSRSATAGAGRSRMPCAASCATTVPRAAASTTSPASSRPS